MCNNKRMVEDGFVKSLNNKDHSLVPDQFVALYLIKINQY